MFLIKDEYHTGNNHGALYYIATEFDEKGKSLGKIANFMGNVVCLNLTLYLLDNPDVHMVDSLPGKYTTA